MQFAILVPLMLAPLICALLWAQDKAARRSGVMTRAQRGLRDALRTAAAEMDFVGLVLVAASLALILVPLGIVPERGNNWEHGSLVRAACNLRLR